MAKIPSKPSNENTQLASDPTGTSGTDARPGGNGDSGPVPPTAGFSIGASKIIEDPRSLRELEKFTRVGHSVIHRIRTEPGYQPSEPNQARLVTAVLVSVNDFRRWPEDGPDDDGQDSEPDARAAETDLEFIYGQKVRRSQLRTRMRALESQLTESELLLGSTGYADFHDEALHAAEHFIHPDAPDPENAGQEAIVQKHLDSRGPDCFVGNEFEVNLKAYDDGTLPECCARYHAEMEAYTEGAEYKAWLSNWWEACRAHVESVYGRKCDDRELGITIFALEFTRSLLPAPHRDGPTAQYFRLVSEFKTLLDELQQHIGKIPQRTRVHLQAQQLLESLTAEHQQLTAGCKLDLKKSRVWGEIMQRAGDGLKKHEALRLHFIAEHDRRYLLGYDLVAHFEFEDLPASTRASYSESEKQKWIDRRREEIRRGERAWQ